MDYSSFVADRRHRWDGFERRLAAARIDHRGIDHHDLEELAMQYRLLLHDHAFARARFPGTGAATRLERLAIEGTRMLRRAGPGRRWSLAGFFARTFPAALDSVVPELVLCIVLFTLAAGLGFVLGVAEPDMGVLILGPERIDDLRDGRLWTETLTTTVPASSSSYIATNNMSVALTAWAGGAAAGLGAFYIVLVNGFHLGTVFSVTSHYGMSVELGEFIVAHGPLELSLILVCAAAGLGLGRALVVAQDRPRSVVVKEQSMRSLVVLIGCLPWFVVLAVIETIVSPSAAVPPSIKVGVGAALVLVFILVAFRPGSEAAHDH